MMDLSLLYRKFRTFLSLADFSALYKTAGILLISCIIFLLVYFWAERNRKEKLSSAACFIMLFLLYSLRTWNDTFAPYLWAEDGSVLIQGSIFDGINSIFQPRNGTYWVIQKIIALLCYRIVLPFNQLQVLPLLQGTITKLIAVFSVFYFMSSRFEWLVKKKIQRFYICAGIILLMPMHSADVLTCDTSLPFLLNFTVFLLSLDFMFRKKAAMLSITETIFIILMALSTAAAPFAAAAAVLAAGRWVIAGRQENTLTRKDLLSVGIKLIFIAAAAFMQVMCLFSGSRVNKSLDIINRLILNTRSFIFFPYWENFHSWTFFFLGLIIWLFLMYRSKISKCVILYCAGFSYAFLLYCSMTSPAASFYQSIAGRYVFLSYEISVLLLGLALCSLFAEKGALKRLGQLILAVCLAVAAISYHVKVIGEEFIDVYRVNIGVFQEDGKNLVKIPIGPWELWLLTIPADLPDKFIEDMDIKINKIQKGYEHFQVSGLIESAGQDYARLFLKLADESYIAAVSLAKASASAKQYTFSISIPSDAFPSGCVLEFVGQTLNEEYHSRKVTVAPPLN